VIVLDDIISAIDDGFLCGTYILNCRGGRMIDNAINAEIRKLDSRFEGKIPYDTDMLLIHNITVEIDTMLNEYMNDNCNTVGEYVLKHSNQSKYMFQGYMSFELEINLSGSVSEGFKIESVDPWFCEFYGDIALKVIPDYNN